MVHATSQGYEGKISTVDEGYVRVQQVAARIGMSEDWVRRFFANAEGVRRIKSPAKRFKRPYTILLIPAGVVERELRKVSGPGYGDRTASVPLVRRSSRPQ